MRRAGLAYIPDERMRDGVVATFSVAENLMLMDTPGRRIGATASFG